MKLRGRIYPNVVVKRNVANQSDRTGGVRPSIIVLHSTESHNRKGNSDLEAIAAFFDDPRVEASSHVVVDGDGNSARCVPDARKAWTCVGYNSVSLNIEQIGSAADGRAGWRARWPELRETARWIARWSRKYRIPIRNGRVSNGTVTRSGIVYHSELGAEGGGHSDPGPYPRRRVLLLARAYKLLQQRR